MKTKDNFIKKTILRFVSAVLAWAILMAYPTVPIVHAEPDMETPTDIAVDVDTDDTAASDTTGGEVGVTENGEEKDFDSGEQWQEHDVTGSDTPTRKLIKKDVSSVKKAVDKDVYALTVATGNQPGTSVEYIVVRYNDNNNIAQTKYIFPKTHSIQSSYNYIMNKTTIGSSIKSIPNYTRRKPGLPSALDSWSVDEYLFVAESGINSITGIEAFMSSGSWSVQGMTVCKVDSVSGIGEYGRVSGKYFYNIGKTRICSLQSKKSGMTTISSKGDNIVVIEEALLSILVSDL